MLRNIIRNGLALLLSMLNRERQKLLISVFWGVWTISLALSGTIAEAADSTKLLFLGNRNIAPVVYLDNTIPVGVAVDIVRELAKHMPQPVEIRAMDWPEAQALVARGEADALIQINPTEERKKIYDFSEPLLESQFSIFTTTNRVGISGASSLSGLRAGVESGGLPRQVLEKNPLIQLTIIPNFLEGFKLLNEGAIDAVVVDYRVGSYIIAENKLRNIKVTGKPIAFSYSSIAVKKGNTKLLAAINNALEIIKADGSYEKILDKWKPKEVVFQTREQITQRIYTVIILILLIVSLIAAIWTLTLKRELAKRKTAEEKLRESEVRYRALFEDSPISLWEEDFSLVKQRIDGLKTSGVSDFRAYFEEHQEEVIRCASAAKIIAVNRATLQLFKADSKEQLLEGLSSIFIEESFDIFREELITLASGGIQFQSEAVQKNLAGELFDTVVRLSIAPGYENNWEKVFVSVSDITERKRAEEDRREIDARYRRIVDTASEGICSLGADHMITFVNARMAEMLGYPGEEMIDRPLTDFMFEEDAPDHLNKMENRLQGFSENYERRFRRKDGSAVWTLASATPIFDDEHYFQGSFAMFTDITERKLAEDELRRLKDELEKRVNERTAELAAKNADLEKMNKIFVGRELRMVELKERIAELEGKTAENIL